MARRSRRGVPREETETDRMGATRAGGQTADRTPKRGREEERVLEVHPGLSKMPRHSLQGRTFCHPDVEAPSTPGASDGGAPGGKGGKEEEMGEEEQEQQGEAPTPPDPLRLNLLTTGGAGLSGGRAAQGQRGGHGWTCQDVLASATGMAAPARKSTKREEGE